MKKYVAVVGSLVLAFGLTGCGQSDKGADAEAAAQSGYSAAEQSYLDYMTDAGFRTGSSQTDLVDLGEQTCNALADNSPEQAAKLVRPLVSSNDEASRLIAGSVLHMCPQYEDKLRSAAGGAASVQEEQPSSANVGGSEVLRLEYAAVLSKLSEVSTNMSSASTSRDEASVRANAILLKKYAEEGLALPDTASSVYDTAWDGAMREFAIAGNYLSGDSSGWSYATGSLTTANSYLSIVQRAMNEAFPSA